MKKLAVQLYNLRLEYNLLQAKSCTCETTSIETSGRIAMAMNTDLRCLQCNNLERTLARPVEVLLVDFGGVLCNFEETPEIRALMRRHRLDVQASLTSLLFENVASYAGLLGRITADQVLDEIGRSLGISERAMREIWDAFLAANVADQPLLDVLSRTRRHTRLFVLSNYWSNGREVIGHKVPMATFDGLYISAELGLRKPDQAIWDYLIRTLAVPPGAIALLDDDAANVRSACEAGLEAYLWVGR